MLAVGPISTSEKLHNDSSHLIYHTRRGKMQSHPFIQTLVTQSPLNSRHGGYGSCRAAQDSVCRRLGYGRHWCVVSSASLQRFEALKNKLAFIEKLLHLDTSMRYKIVTCGEERHCAFSYDQRSHCRLITFNTVAYNRVALTEYFQHRNVEKLYLNPRELPAWPSTNMLIHI